MEIQGVNKFKIIAFQKAARVLAELPRDVATIPRDELQKIDGVGKGTADRIAAPSPITTNWWGNFRGGCFRCWTSRAWVPRRWRCSGGKAV